MKVLIVSDIHGDYETFKKVIENEEFDKLVVLGDLFDYGFYDNDLNDNKIINLLKKYKDILVLIRGNCDSFIDYEKYNLYAHDEITLTINKIPTTFTHGNLYNSLFMPKYHGLIFISGHTHIPIIENKLGMIFANPGSIGKPRAGSKKGYLIFEDDKLILKDVNKNIIKEMIIN